MRGAEHFIKAQRAFLRSRQRANLPNTGRNLNIYNFDKFLNGDEHVIELNIADDPGLMEAFRAKAHREAAKRLIAASVTKLSGNTFSVQAFNPWPVGHMLWVEGQKVLTALTGPVSPSPVDAAPVVRPEPVDPWTDPDVVPGPGLGVVGQLPPAEPGVLAEVEPTDDELLGPCTCGQAPFCLPECARAQ